MTELRTVRPLRRSVLLLAVGLALATGRSSAAIDLVSDHLAGPPVIIHGSGSADTLNVVILGDGFTADNASMTAYRDAADRLAAELLATDPFAVLSSALTIYRLDVTSNQAGIDVPVDCGGQPYDTPPMSDGTPFPWSRSPKSPDNILDTHWCAVDVISGATKKRFLGSDTDRVPTFASAAGVIPHITIVLVNDWMFGATAFADSAVMFVSISQNLVGDVNPDTGLVLTPNVPNSFPAVAVHELGHLSPFLLIDEYSHNRPVTELPAQQGVIDDSPNLTTSLSPLKWESLVAPGTARPTDCALANPPEVGGAEGGFGFSSLVYRSRCGCKMKDYPDATFCIVCRQRIFRGLEAHVAVFDYVAPRKSPSPIPQKPDPSPMWVILDELAVKSGPSGWYSIEYTISTEGPPRSGRPQTVTGVWPRDRGVYLQRGQTVAIDDLLTIVPAHWLTPPSALTVNYRLVWRPKVGDSAGAPTLVAQEHAQIPLARLNTGIIALNRPTHRLTVALLLPH